MAFAAVPGVEQIGEAIVDEAGNLAHDRQAHQPAEPCVARCAQPDLGGTVGADEQPSFGIDRVQPAAHVLDPRAKNGESLRLEIDIAELDRTGAGCTHEPAALPLDPAIADRAFGVVPNDEPRTHRPTIRTSGADR